MTREELIQTRVDTETKEKIQKEADSLGISVSDYIRKVVTGEFPLLKDIKEQLDRIEKELKKT